MAGLGAADIAAIGITNQRETTVVWDRATGVPVAPAIVWQSRITAARCEALRAAGHEARVRALTGLPLDAYFSGPKIAHILDSRPGLRARAEAGELACGTIDSWLVWRLTGGRVHATDVSNASRTLLFDITSARLGSVAVRHLGRAAAAAAGRGQLQRPGGRDRPGLVRRRHPHRRASRGTSRRPRSGRRASSRGRARTPTARAPSCCATSVTTPVISGHGLLTTVLWRLGDDAAASYAREGLRVRGGRRGPVAARRAAGHRLRGGRGTARRERVPCRWRLPGARVHGARRAVVGSHRARPAHRHHAGHGSRGHRTGDHRLHRLPGRRRHGRP